VAQQAVLRRLVQRGTISPQLKPALEKRK